jgi:hypothetical protein
MSAPKCRVCGLPVSGEAACDPRLRHDEWNALKASYLHPSCAVLEEARMATEAKRIADAAPDLLAACEAIDALDCCTGCSFPESDWPRFWEALEKARAALARARGA